LLAALIAREVPPHNEEMAAKMAEIRALPLRRSPQHPQPQPGRLDPCQTCTARSLTVCASLNPEEQARLSAMSNTVCLQPHQTLFQEGDDADSVYNITCGSVSISKSLSDGRRQITGFLGAGDFLGLNTRDAYTVSAEALTDTRVCKFPRQAFGRLMAELPNLEHRLLAVAETELAAAQEQILLLGRKTAMERIASFLLLQAERIRARGLPDNPVSLPMTRAEVADYLGLTIETVSRCFTKLRKLDVIGLPASDRVQIRQPERLKALSEAV
jgi:CRP/FNR family transcriptional regulator